MKTGMTSQITFIYVDDLDGARHFFDQQLELERVYDPKWACVWRVAEKAYVGAVDVTRGSIEVPYRGGSLISLTVDDAEAWRKDLIQKGLTDLSEIKHFEDIGLKSFFFKGPNGYEFEIQEFVNEEIKALF